MARPGRWSNGSVAAGGASSDGTAAGGVVAGHILLGAHDGGAEAEDVAHLLVAEPPLDLLVARILVLAGEAEAARAAQIQRRIEGPPARLAVGAAHVEDHPAVGGS